jgi:addiction module HigA family antidote
VSIAFVNLFAPCAKRKKVALKMISLHPGGIIRRRYLEPLELSLTDVAKAMDVSVSSISRIVNEKAEISSDMALRLSYVLGGEASTWLNLQTAYNLQEAKKGFDHKDLKKLWHPEPELMELV